MSAARYRIGTVARLAGLTTHAIRVWERRYGAAAPSRTPGGARLYTEEDVQRFKLIKQLLEHGYSTRAIANLDLTQLSALAAPENTTVPAPSVVVSEQARAHVAIEALLDAVSEMDPNLEDYLACGAAKIVDWSTQAPGGGSERGHIPVGPATVAATTRVA